MIRIFTLLLLLVATSSAFAQRASIDPAFDTLLTDSAHSQKTLETAKNSTTWLKNPCPDATFTRSPKLGISQPPIFDANHNLTSGAWTEPVIAHGCGADRQLNVLYFVDPNKTLRSVAILPGTSRAEPVLQKDGVMYAVMAAGKDEDKNCKDFYINDTKFLDMGPPGKGMPAEKQSWNEEWQLIRCNDRITVTMHFIPDATGTVIRTKPSETKHEAIKKVQ